jgi:sortase A
MKFRVLQHEPRTPAHRQWVASHIDYVIAMNAKRWIEIFSWGTGACLLATYGGALAWSSYASNRGLEAMREARAADTVESQPSPGLNAGPAVAMHPLAVLRIPSLRLEVPVHAGTSVAVLHRGAGLIEGTALPGSDAGNIGIAAHRDGFFRPLQGIRADAELYIDTVHSTRRYRVTSISVVAPQNVAVLDDTGRPSVTLVTCYPFYFVGAAPQRFIVRAEIVP